MRVHLEMLGCRLNEAEIATWGRQFQAQGDELVGNVQDADVVVLNTCAVTAEAGRKSRNWLKRVQKYNPETRLVATGCYATLAPEKLAEGLGVDLVIPNDQKDELVSLIQRGLRTQDMPKRAVEPDAVPLFRRGRTRSFIKVQDGCRNKCSFCIVTVVRGDEKSRTISDIVEEINHLVAEGVQEAVLTGVHVGGYGADLGQTLSDLIRAILNDTALPRLRLASVEPWDLPNDFFTLWTNERLMPHIHLPLQSGCNSVLKRMSRRCSTERYKELVTQARATVPSMNITTDIIVGFPGETEEEWEATFKFAKEMAFQHMHIFTYSPREGTRAARLPHRVPGPVQKARSQQLHGLGQVMKRQAFEACLNQTVPVLFESSRPAQEGGLVFSGYTPNYFKVEVAVPAAIDLHNQIEPVALTGLSRDPSAMTGQIKLERLEQLPPQQTGGSAPKRHPKSTLLHVVGQH